MISHGCSLYGLEESGFLADAFALLTLVTPLAVCYTLWRIFVTNRSGPRGDIIDLGLDDSSAVYSDLDPRGIPPRVRLYYIATSAATFLLGLLAFQISELLKALI